ncbi:pyrroloquinoline quinone precursor peptide PqqA [Halomonas salipaludis]|uniref:Coenzyme PQQ synthesis protein A n=2 Tax=Halomonadaceae TaxID=28256 RepID=A0A2A2ERD8_9GAMM|nr:pyrroloquinoline quinone precursor peptide PqqA [Halomonas salipaludis]
MQYTSTANRSVPMWTKPTYQDLRLGFEVTLYISNR